MSRLLVLAGLTSLDMAVTDREKVTSTALDMTMTGREKVADTGLAMTVGDRGKVASTALDMTVTDLEHAVTSILGASSVRPEDRTLVREFGGEIAASCATNFGIEGNTVL